MSETFGFGKLPGALMKKWPKDGDGQPVPPKFLTHCPSTDMADAMLVNMLDAYGIPALVLHPGDGAFGKLVLGLSGTGSSIFVPETLYDDASLLMDSDGENENLLMEGNDDDGLQSGI